MVGVGGGGPTGLNYSASVTRHCQNTHPSPGTVRAGTRWVSGPFFEQLFGVKRRQNWFLEFAAWPSVLSSKAEHR